MSLESHQGTTSSQSGQSYNATLARASSRASSHCSKVRSYPYKTRRLVDYLSQRVYSPYQTPWRITNLARNHPPFLHRLKLMKKLPVHDGCVNTICWNKSGEYILSGSDDCNLCITKPAYMFDDSKDYSVLHKVRTRHFGNIFSAQFIPNSADALVVSCSSEGPVILHDINGIDPSNSILSFNCHSRTIFEVVTLPDNDNVFMSCSDDKTVRLFDMRCHKSCSRPGTCTHPFLIRNSHPISTLSVHPMNSNLILVGRADGVGLVYDRRKLPNVSEFSRERAHQERLAYFEENPNSEGMPSACKYYHPLDGVVGQFSAQMEEKCRFTSLCYSADGSQVLASYSEDYIYLFNHDRSSNFELVQTLPKKEPSTSSQDTEKNNYGNDTESNSESGRSRINRAARIQRMRMRGDWSDTGVNSIPNSGRTARRQSNLLRRMTEVALALRTGVRLRGVESDEQRNSASNTTESSDAATAENRPQVIEEDEEESRDNESNHVADEDVEFSGTDEESKNSNTETRDSESKRAEESNYEVSYRPKISLATRMKFRQASDGLKDKYKDIPTYEPRVKYQGHRNCRTSIKKAIFWGDDFIMSGSDCGRIMVWEKDTAKLVMGFPADERVVNCLAPNPQFYALASSGIDYDIKLWSTQGVLDSPLRVSDEEMNKIIENNELMLEESKQTISVPPEIFFQVLAQLARSH